MKLNCIEESKACYAHDVVRNLARKFNVLLGYDFIK